MPQHPGLAVFRILCRVGLYQQHVHPIHHCHGVLLSERFGWNPVVQHVDSAQATDRIPLVEGHPLPIVGLNAYACGVYPLHLSHRYGDRDAVRGQSRMGP